MNNQDLFFYQLKKAKKQKQKQCTSSCSIYACRLYIRMDPKKNTVKNLTFYSYQIQKDRTFEKWTPQTNCSLYFVENIEQFFFSIQTGRPNTHTYLCRCVFRTVVLRKKKQMEKVFT